MRNKRWVPGCIFVNHGRYWWRIRLPGELKARARPLVPAGCRYATDDPAVAEEIARNMFAHAVYKAGGNGDGPKAKKDHFDGTVASLVRKYLDYCRGYYLTADGQPTGEADKIALATRHLVEHCPSHPVEAFGPRLLKAVRQEMIEADLCRTQVNKRVGQIKRMFRWAAEEQLAPPSVWYGLQAVMGLKRWRSGARESEPVRPIAEFWVRKTMGFLPPTVAAMVELQMLTAMRPGELCIIRPMDVDRRGKVWLYTPASHKTAYHGHRRVVPIGPRGQAILGLFLTRPPEDYCFAPHEAQAQRNAVKRANRKTPVQPSQRNRRKPNPKQFPGERYDSDSYRSAIEYAIAAANKAIRNQAAAEGREVGEAELVPHWHPHQLRHTAATLVRREMGLDAARTLLGHRSLGITDTYAELDQALAVEAARKLG